MGSSDTTKKLAFEVDAQTASVVTTINTGAQTASYSVTFPVLPSSSIFAVSAAALTSGRIPYATTNGLLTNDSQLSYGAGVITLGTGGHKISGSASTTYLKLASGASSSAGALFYDLDDILLARLLVAADSFTLKNAADAAILTATSSLITLSSATTQATNWTQTGATTISTGTGVGTYSHTNETHAGTATFAQNVGINIAASSSWASNHIVLEISTATPLRSGISRQTSSQSKFGIFWNAYGATGDDVWNYANTGDSACNLTFTSRTMQFRTAAAGTINNTITWSDAFTVNSTVVTLASGINLAMSGASTLDTGTGAVSLNGATTCASSIKSTSATLGIGYGTSAGGAVTQITSRTTGVTLNTVCGGITLFSAAGSATYQSFTVTNSTVAATDTIIVNQKSGTDLNIVIITAVAAGSFRISFATTGGTTVEQPVFNFSVIKAVAA